MEKFTKELCDLFVNKKLPLTECLKIMAKKPAGKVKKAAEYVYSVIEKGELFSNALKTCPYISFDNVYVTFILLAEKSGNLQMTINYLNKKCQRDKENKSKLIGSIIYPAFVILFSFVVCIYLNRLFSTEDSIFIYKFFSFLIFVCGLLVFIIYKFLGTNKVYEAFLAADLLIKEGISASVAVAYGSIIAGIDSKTGRVFMEASRKIELGMNLRTAFNLDKNLEDFFYYVDESGGGKDIFEKIALWIGDKDEKKRTICMQLIEPVFIAVTGSFLFSIILNFISPVINTGLIF